MSLTKHLKLFFTISIFLLNGKSLAQNDSLVDVFPLAIGNKWTYDYYSSLWTMDDVLESDIGTANCRVVNETIFTDSTIWLIKENRDLLHHIHQGFPPSFDTTYPIIDSSTFELIESHQTRHRIYRNETLISISGSVFPYGNDVNDSGIVFRYMNVSAEDTISIQARDTNLYYRDVLDFTFKKEIGAIRIHGRNSPYVVGVGWESKHHLISAVINEVQNPNNHSFPPEFILHQNNPNPFNPNTNFSFNLYKPTIVSLKIYDILGNEVATLVNEKKDAGNYFVQWNAEKFPSGMYFYQLKSEEFSQTKKLILMK